ncbi:MAG: hypothetical protein IKC11_00830 [Clostridia bacterium]|nr:hypothetical protein [Clostridia bacterium]
MLEFISQLEDKDFLDLLVSMGKMKYDNSRLCDYFDEKERRMIWVYDNGRCFNGSGSEELWITDFEASNEECTLIHNVFMMRKFGEDWFSKAKRHFEETSNPRGLEILNNAKTQQENESKENKEATSSLEEEESSK